MAKPAADPSSPMPSDPTAPGPLPPATPAKKDVKDLVTAYNMFQGSNADDIPAPTGCTHRRYDAKDDERALYEAKLPKGTVLKGTQSKTASYGGGLRTQDAAYNITQTWLDEAAAFQKLV